MKNSEKKLKLQRYAESLQRKLQAAVPAKHLGRVAEYKQMILIDLKKTMIAIERLG